MADSSDYDDYAANNFTYEDDTNYTALNIERERLLRPWWTVPLLLSLLAIGLHAVAARVLWVVSVRRRFGHPTADDLHQILLSVSAACLLQMGTYTVAIIANFATPPGQMTYGICVTTMSLYVCSPILLRLLVAFLVIRVGLNRPMLRAHRIFIVTASLLALVLIVVYATLVAPLFCGADGIANHVYDIHHAYAIFDACLLLVTFLLLCLALCAVGMRRRRNPAVEFQSSAESGPAERAGAE